GDEEVRAGLLAPLVVQPGPGQGGVGGQDGGHRGLGGRPPVAPPPGALPGQEVGPPRPAGRQRREELVPRPEVRQPRPGGGGGRPRRWARRRRLRGARGATATPGWRAPAASPRSVR